MSKQNTTEKNPVHLTKRAIEQFKIALARERFPDSGVRVLLINVGSGYRYDLQIENTKKADDHVSVQGGIKIYIDSFSLQHLKGIVLDFYTSSIGEGFLFKRNKKQKQQP